MRRAVLYVNVGNAPRDKADQHAAALAGVFARRWPDTDVVGIPVRDRPTELVAMPDGPEDYPRGGCSNCAPGSDPHLHTHCDQEVRAWEHPSAKGRATLGPQADWGLAGQGDWPLGHVGSVAFESPNFGTFESNAATSFAGVKVGPPLEVPPVTTADWVDPRTLLAEADLAPVGDAEQIQFPPEKPKVRMSPPVYAADVDGTPVVKPPPEGI